MARKAKAKPVETVAPEAVIPAPVETPVAEVQTTPETKSAWSNIDGAWKLIPRT